MKFLILGDCHGKFHDVDVVMNEVDFNLKIKYDAAIQVGDFGFFPLCFDKLDRFKHVLKKDPTNELGVSYDYLPLKFHKKVYAIDGNHEDFEFLKKSNIKEWEEKYNIIYQPRGSYLDIDGYKIGFIGGALHADRAQEGSTKKETTNYILNKQVLNAINEWNSIGGVDTVISHSCPSNIGIGMEGHPNLYMTVQRYIVEAGYGDNNFNDCGENALTKLYKGLNNKPSNWIYGHFHQSKHKLVDNTNFWCVGSTDSSDGHKYIKPFILNTNTKEIEFHDKIALNFDGRHSTRII